VIAVDNEATSSTASAVTDVWMTAGSRDRVGVASPNVVRDNELLAKPTASTASRDYAGAAEHGGRTTLRRKPASSLVASRSFGRRLFMRECIWVSKNMHRLLQNVVIHLAHYYAPAPNRRGIKRCFCLTSSVCLSRTSGLSREQRGLGRPKLAQR